jgi:hypothetical protein
VDAAVPRHLDVHLIMDNYGTHKTPLIRHWFAACERRVTSVVEADVVEAGGLLSDRPAERHEVIGREDRSS